MPGCEDMPSVVPARVTWTAGRRAVQGTGPVSLAQLVVIAPQGVGRLSGAAAQHEKGVFDWSGLPHTLDSHHVFLYFLLSFFF